LAGRSFRVKKFHCSRSYRHKDVLWEMQLDSFAHEVNGSGVRTTESPAIPAATLSPGWYPDPHLRWRARYWDGRAWTERVAGPGQDPTRPVFGLDALAPPERTHLRVVPEFARLVDAVSAAELTHLRAEVETWRGVAEQRGHALTKALNALESLAARCEQPAATPTEHRVGPVDEPAARSALVTIPDSVRAAALSELHTLPLKQRRRFRLR
jgi:Protein of unknown function (DUF2510)